MPSICVLSFQEQASDALSPPRPHHQMIDTLPRLQPSLESRLRAAVQAHGVYEQREAGESLYVEGEVADSLVLLVQGQVRPARGLV
jgi:hypothetical protein